MGHLFYFKNLKYRLKINFFIVFFVAVNLLICASSLFSAEDSFVIEQNRIIGRDFFFSEAKAGQSILEERDDQLILSNQLLKAIFRKDDNGWVLEVVNLITQESQKFSDPFFNLQIRGHFSFPGRGIQVELSQVVKQGQNDSDFIFYRAGLSLENRELFSGLIFTLVDPRIGLKADVFFKLADHSNSLSKTVRITALKSLKVKQMTLWENLNSYQAVGSVPGSPLQNNSFFITYEHPVSQITKKGRSSYSLTLQKKRSLNIGDTFIDSGSIGVFIPNQKRRSFIHYLERRRATPYFQFLHYNSWYDIAWYERPFSVDECLEVIQGWKDNFIDPYDIHLDSFVLDDGWDDYDSVWQFHPTRFPDGFSPLNKLADQFGSGIGVWISPAGGYLGEQEKRLAAGSLMDLPQNQSGFLMSQKKYYDYFKEKCRILIEDNHVNCFKFDRLAGDFSETGQLEDKEAAMRLAVELREYDPSLFINITVGTWPSPFWLFSGDSTWRGGGGDIDLWGKGNNNQKWLNFRDGATFKSIVSRAPYYPVSSLMTHGIVFANLGLAADLDGDLSDWERQVKSYFASGVNLQEMYINYRMMKPDHWKIVAFWVKWAQNHEDLFADSHWVGGNPIENEIYGWASWNGEKATLSLRNPDDSPQKVVFNLRQFLELPPFASGNFQLKAVSGYDNKDTDSVEIGCSADDEIEIKLEAHGVVVYDISSR